MTWTVVFNDGSKTTVVGSWLIEAVVNACVHVQKNYTEVVSAYLQYDGG
jgi:hypothetical protein